MLFFASHGYPCYAVSYRGHGGSWYPSFLQMYFTSREAIAGDLVAGITEVERLEGERRKSEEKVGVVMIAHSAGGALSQWVLSKGLVRVQAFCLFAAVPGFGSYAPNLLSLCDEKLLMWSQVVLLQVLGSFGAVQLPLPLLSP
jgi:pimeloyl-ACP methyl ester carboxylesterase